MAAVLVQASKAFGGTGNLTATLNGVASGNTLLLVVVSTVPAGTGFPQPASITGMMATLSAEAAVASQISGYGAKPRIYHQHNVTAGNKSVTVELTGESYSMCFLAEVSGLATAAPDRTAVDGNGTGSSLATNATAVTSQADNFVLAIPSLQADNTNTTFTVPSGYSRGAVHVDGSNNSASAFDYKVTSAAAAQSAAWTSNQSGQWTSVLAVFKAAGGGGGPTPVVATLAVNTAPSTVSSTASSTVRANAAVTTGASTVASVSTAAVRANASMTTGASTVVSAASSQVRANANIVAAPATVSSTASSTVRANAAMLTGPSTLTSTAVSVPNGSGVAAITTGAATLSSTASSTVVANASATTDPSTLTSTAIVTPVVPAALTVLTQPATLTATASVRVTASASLQTGDSTLAAYGRNPSMGDVETHDIVIPMAVSGFRMPQAVNILRITP